MGPDGTGRDADGGKFALLRYLLSYMLPSLPRLVLVKHTTKTSVLLMHSTFFVSLLHRLSYQVSRVFLSSVLLFRFLT